MATVSGSLNYLHYKRRTWWSDYEYGRPMPDVYRVTLGVIHDPINVSPSASELNYSAVFRPFDIWDPNVSWGGFSANGFAELALNYDYWFVRKSWYKARLTSDAQVQGVDARLFMIPLDDPSYFPSGGAGYNDILRRFPRVRMMSKFKHLNTAMEMDGSIDWQEFLQLQNPYDDPDCYGSFNASAWGTGTSPTNERRMAIGFARDNMAWSESGSLVYTLSVTQWFDVFCIRSPNDFVDSTEVSKFVPYSSWWTQIEGLEEADDDGTPTVLIPDTAPTATLASISGHTDDP